MRALLLVLSLFLLLSAFTLAETIDASYDLLGRDSFDGLVAYDYNDSLIFVLGSHSLAMLDRYTPGERFTPLFTIPLETRYDHCHLAGHWLYLYAADGHIATVRVWDQSVELLSEQSFGDSIFSMAGAGRYLYFAQGLSGISIVDTRDKKRLSPIGKAEHGAYYSMVKLHDTLLAAVDLANGIDFYLIQKDGLVFWKTYLTDDPVSDLSIDWPLLLACYGNQWLSAFAVPAITGPDLLFEDELAGQLLQLAHNNELAVLAFRDGILATYDLDSLKIRDSLQLPFPPQQMEMADGPAEAKILYLDVTGKFMELGLDQSALTLERNYQSPAHSVAQAARGNELVTATADGRWFRYRFNDRAFSKDQIREFGLNPTAIAATDSFLIVASLSPPSLYLFFLKGNQLDLLTSINTNFISEKLFIHKGQGDDLIVFSTDQSGIKCFRYNAHFGKLKRIWKIDSFSSVAAPLLGEDLLAVADAQGRLSLYRGVDRFAALDFVAQFDIPQGTRAVAFDDRGYLFVGGSDGLRVFQLDLSLDALTPLTHFEIPDQVYDIAVDNSRRIAVTANGNSGAHFLDFDHPEQAGPIQNLPGSKRATTVLASGGYLYALGPESINAYRFLGGPDSSALDLPVAIEVTPCFPNPFNGETRVDISVGRGIVYDGKVIFHLYNILGQQIDHGEVDGRRNRLSIIWDGRDSNDREVASGVYLMRVSAGSAETVRKMVFVK